MNTSIPLSLLLLRHISEIRLRLTPLPAAPAESAQARSRSRACTSGGDLKTPSGVGDSVRKLSESTDSGARPDSLRFFATAAEQERRKTASQAAAEIGRCRQIGSCLLSLFVL